MMGAMTESTAPDLPDPPAPAAGRSITPTPRESDALNAEAAPAPPFGAPRPPPPARETTAAGEETPATLQEADECMSYTAYIAATDQEEATAADLNAGMLAEWSSGGATCDNAGRRP